MVFNAADTRDALYHIGFQPALKIVDVEVWIHTRDGLYASLWWIGDVPNDSCLLQSEHVRFELSGKARLRAVIEPGVLRTYIPLDHDLWRIKDDEDNEEEDDD